MEYASLAKVSIFYVQYISTIKKVHKLISQIVCISMYSLGFLG